MQLNRSCLPTLGASHETSEKEPGPEWKQAMLYKEKSLVDLFHLYLKEQLWIILSQALYLCLLEPDHSTLHDRGCKPCKNIYLYPLWLCMESVDKPIQMPK